MTTNPNVPPGPNVPPPVPAALSPSPQVAANAANTSTNIQRQTQNLLTPQGTPAPAVTPSPAAANTVIPPAAPVTGTPPPSNVRNYSLARLEEKTQTGINASVPYAGVASATALVAGAGTLSSLPILGNIPYLPEVAGAIQSGITSVTSALNLNTGAYATYPALGYLWDFVGPTALAGVGLAGLGQLNEWFSGRVESSGLNMFKKMWNGVRAPVDLPIALTKGIGKGIGWSWKKVFGDKVNGTKGGIRNSWNWVKNTASNNWKAVLGAGVSAGLLVPTGGLSFAWAGLGFAGTKLAERQGYLGGKKSVGAPSSDAHSS